jgi:hypothetical protein
MLMLSLASVTHAVNPENRPMSGLISDQTFTATTDSMPFARVVVYRPDNQLSRPYKMRSNLGETFQIGRKEVVKMAANAKLFQGSISAFGHNRGHFSHELSPNKVHYFRLQDRNNYSGFLPYLEVIEVTEETFRMETLGGGTK